MLCAAALPTAPGCCVLQAGCGHSLSAVHKMSVWFMSLISAGMAVASVVVNDYFDLKIDTTNAPDKPLPSGARVRGIGRLLLVTACDVPLTLL